MFMFQAGRKDRSDALNTAIDRMTKKTRDLRRQVCFSTLTVLNVEGTGFYVVRSTSCAKDIGAYAQDAILF